jgi:hypothetical protein
MSIVTIDDKFDDLFLHQFYDTVSNIPVCQDNVANRYSFPYGKKGTHTLQGQCIFARNGINEVSVLWNPPEVAQDFFRILKHIETIMCTKYYLHRIDLNVQHKGADGCSHTDAENTEDLTIMMMTSPVWKPEWGGQFEIMNMQETEVASTIDYVPGRVIVFPGIIPHRGLGPSVDGVYRSTVVWRVTPLDIYMKRQSKTNWLY